MTYTDMYKKDENSDNIRKLMFKEHTSVLSYYIVTLILMNSYQDTLNWCDTNNNNLLQFKKTSVNLSSFCELIEKKYRTRSLLDGIKCSEDLFINVEKRLKKQKSLLYLMKSLRMTICELG